MQSVGLISITPDAERIIGYCARVSNPQNQDNPDVAKLLAYCIKHGHWSVFEMSHMILEITTTRAIAAQILRHKSFSFQEFSQRYAEASSYIPCEARRQDDKNRQNSVDDLDEDTKIWFRNLQEDTFSASMANYKNAIKRGVAKECARMLLPLNTETTLYMSGSIRSWIHYLELRCANGTQLEHKNIADSAKLIFAQELPVIAKALGYDRSP